MNLHETAQQTEAPTPAPRGAEVVRVSIVIPAYKAIYLGAALDSALAQDFEDFEVVVCDDCPDEAVARVVAPYLEDRRVRYFRNPQPLGEEGNVGECIRRARGTYVKFLYDDDLLLPGCLRAQADVLDRLPGVALVTSRRSLVDEAGTALPDSAATRTPFAHDACVHGGDLTAFLADWTFNFIGEPSAVMVRREQILPLAGKQFSLRGQKVSWLGDLTMHVNLMRVGHLAYLTETLSRFRISTQQTSHIGRLDPEVGRERYAYFKRSLRELGWHRAQDNHLVRLAPLDAPGHFEPVDLGERVNRMAGIAAPAARSTPDEPGTVLARLQIVPGAKPALRLLDNNPVRDWLQRRVPGAGQLALTRERLATPGASVSMCVAVVQERDGDAARLVGTLQSLAEAAATLPALEVHVLGADAGAAATALPCTRHACAAGDVPAAINAIAGTSAADWLMVVEAGARFTPWGLLAVATELVARPELRAVYADEMLAEAPDRDLVALLRPDFNLDLLLSMPAGMSRHWLYRRETFVEAGGFDPAFAESPEFDLLLRLIDAGGIDGFGHVHEPLLVLQPQEIRTRQAELDALLRHLRNRGYQAATAAPHAPGCYRIDYGHAAAPGVSIIIPTRNQLGMLRRCVETLLEKTAYRNYELLIVDNGSDEADACAWLAGIEAMDSPQLRVLRYPHPFNYSAMNNLAARHARGDYLLLLNNDTAILREDWLQALLNHAQRPEVGIVGAKLLYPDGRIQHAGVVLGLRGPAEHPFNGSRFDAPGYMHRLQLDQDYTAVTGACLLIRKSVYEDVGGLDEQAFKVSYNDVDLCLKVRQAGYLVVWTPHAVLLHEGSVSQNTVDDAAQAAKRKRFQGEQDALYDKWLPVIARDPAYNRNLSLEGTGFVLETRSPLNWHPLAWRPLPVVHAMAGDQHGCGHYRIIQPIRAIDESGLADASWGVRYLSPVEMERRAPDTVILQRQMFEDRIVPQQRLARFSRAFRVAELDDYLPNLPRKSAHHGKLPKDVLRTMRETLKLVDRFVVSTTPLAEALEGLHPDIRVVENHLPLPWWGEVKGARRDGKRPRIGWGGGGGHRGDLELIADVVRSLADEVEWVFLGMCPKALRPFVHEFHEPVEIGKYPAKLASLDLDLALAPLEDNLFNRCKSNLRLLEYGACGFPVVCSDIAPYQGDLPVTRVKPRFRDWVDAIHMHTHDLDAAAAAGAALRAAVHRDWMLDEKHAAFWLSQWLPD